MLTNPNRPIFAVHFASSNGQYDTFLLVNRTAQIATVGAQQSDSRSQADALVAVHERMIIDERKPQRGGFFFERRVKFRPAKSHARLRQSRFQRAPVA